MRNSSECTLWKHIPAENYLTDPPSRGCKAKYFVSVTWWEAPTWLRDPVKYCKYIYSSCQNVTYNKLKRKIIIYKSTDKCSGKCTENLVLQVYFSWYDIIVRFVRCILRFRNNLSNTKMEIKGRLTPMTLKKQKWNSLEYTK